MQLTVKVVPGAAKTEISGWLGDALKIRVRAVPEKGQATQTVVALLATTLDVAENRIVVVQGHTQPRKRLRIDGLDAATVHRRLGVPE